MGVILGRDFSTDVMDWGSLKGYGAGGTSHLGHLGQTQHGQVGPADSSDLHILKLSMFSIACEAQRL